MKTIASRIATKFETINLDKLVTEHYDKIKAHGNKKGWPFNLGIVEDGDTYALADINEINKTAVVCSSVIDKDADKDKMVSALSSRINFLI